MTKSGRVDNFKESVLLLDSICRRDGQNNSYLITFHIKFSSENVSIRNHRVRFGINGGELKFILDGLFYDEITPTQTLKIKLKREISSKEASLKGSGSISIKPEGFGYVGKLEGIGQNRNEKIGFTYCQISCGGERTCPIWTFKSPFGIHLEGVCRDITVKFGVPKLLNVFGDFFFTTSLGDWSYDIQEISNALPAYRKAWVRHIIIHEAKKITKILAATYHILSKGTI